MIKIDKLTEPKSLTEFKQLATASYDSLANLEGKAYKGDLKHNLLKEQGYICAYCMSRINLENMKIEHYQPQSKYPNLELEYKNLFAVCSGSFGKDTTCDTQKADQILNNLSPLVESSIQTIAYKKTGEIISSDDLVQTELNQILNLNCEMLIDNRRQQLDNFIRNVTRKKNMQTGAMKRGFLFKTKQELLSKDKKQPYIGIVIWWIEKKLKKTVHL